MVCNLPLESLFFKTTATGEVYSDSIQQFVLLLDVNKRPCWFQQDGVISHAGQFNDKYLWTRDFIPPNLYLRDISKQFPNTLRPEGKY